MPIPEDLKYAATHEWVRQEPDGTCAVGITFHAQERLGDVVFVEPPAVGRIVKQGEECGAIESVKAAADIYAPIAGEVVATNAALSEAPERINQAPYQAWLFRIKPQNSADVQNLLDAHAYQKIAEADEH